MTNLEKAGYFIVCSTNAEDVSKLSTNSLNNLSDIFGNLPYRFVLSLLIKEETKENAFNLFKRIFDETAFNSMMKEVNTYIIKNDEIKELKAKISNLEKDNNVFLKYMEETF